MKKVELFKQEVSEDELHYNLKAINNERYNNKHELSQWAEGFKDRDHKFVKEFQTTFNSSFWELYIFAPIKDYKINTDLSKESPDFIVKKGKHRVYNRSSDNKRRPR